MSTRDFYKSFILVTANREDKKNKKKEKDMKWRLEQEN